MISIIVPIYNAERFLEECLESICRQTCKDLEILLIDDGSADSSPQICERFAEKDSRVRFFQKENGGPSDTRNYGIERASGDYIMFFDSDDYAEPTLCEKLLQAIESAKADFAMCGYYNVATARTTQRLLFEGSREFRDKSYREDILVHTLGLVGKGLKNPAPKYIKEVREEEHYFRGRKRDSFVYVHNDGTEFFFPKDLDATKQTMTPEQAVRVWEQVPEDLRKLGQKKVEVVDFRNPDDPHWAKAYHEKDFRSYATGGDRITFYAWDDPHNEKYMVKTYAHEIGHGVDRKTNLISAGRSKVKYAISEMGKWKTAMRKDRELSGYRSPTSYGTKARAEDFAESIATYTTKREWFKTHFPNRTKIIEEFLKLN